ncbi:MAG: hypothetical protein QW814_02280, partial [Methanothrix sp.]
PTYGEQGIEAIKKTNGTAISVSEDSLRTEQKRFMEDYGLVAELASVSTITAFETLKLKGSSVAVITGSNV